MFSASDEQEWRRQYHLDRYHDIRKRMLAYLGGKCVECGTSDNLHIHHKDPSQKEFNVCADGWGRPWDDMVAELDKCELRCVYHHIKIHEAEHGTISRYRGHRCRCDACRSVWNAACVRWKASSRSKKKEQMGRCVSGLNDGPLKPRSAKSSAGSNPALPSMARALVRSKVS